ncbi:MAG: hypothetical protein R3E08_10220 [Thiotrichaceae bacterium]
MVGWIYTLGINIKVKEVHVDHVLTGFEIEPLTELPRPLDGLGADLATALQVERVRIIETSVDSFGIEVANAHPEKINLGDLLASQEYQLHASAMPLALGKVIGGYPLLKS